MLEPEASRDICEYDSIGFELFLHEQAKQHWVVPDPLCIPDSSWLHSLQLSSLKQFDLTECDEPCTMKEDDELKNV